MWWWKFIFGKFEFEFSLSLSFMQLMQNGENWKHQHKKSSRKISLRAKAQSERESWKFKTKHTHNHHAWGGGMMETFLISISHREKKKLACVLSRRNANRSSANLLLSPCNIKSYPHHWVSVQLLSRSVFGAMQKSVKKFFSHSSSSALANWNLPKNDFFYNSTQHCRKSTHRAWSKLSLCFRLCMLLLLFPAFQHWCEKWKLKSFSSPLLFLFFFLPTPLLIQFVQMWRKILSNLIFHLRALPLPLSGRASRCVSHVGRRAHGCCWLRILMARRERERGKSWEHHTSMAS